MSMRALRWTVPAAVAVLFSCSNPMDGCACPPARTHAVLYGTVTDAAQQPVPGALVQAAVYGTVCGQGFGEFQPSAGPVPAGADGTYRIHALTVYAHRSSCMEVVALDAEGGNPGRVTAAVPMRWEREPPDSVRIDIRLPQATSSFSRQ